MNKKRTMRMWMAWLLLCPALFSGSSVAEDLTINDVMYSDPLLEMPNVLLAFDPRLKTLWELALRRPDSELQRLAADTIAIAHQRGMQDLGSTSGELAKMLQRPETAASVRRAAANALATLDAKQFAPVLVEAAKTQGLELQMVVEPALARWGNDAFRETWQQRLASDQTPSLLRLFAIDGLGALRDKSSKAALLNLVRDSQSAMHYRVAAARSLARIGEGGVLEDAQRLLKDKSPSAMADRLLGVYLLSSHRDESARAQLVELAADTEPAIAGAALERLFELDPKLVIPLAAAAIKNNDVKVRRTGTKALIVRGDLATIAEIIPLLDDPNPGLRRLVTKSLFDLAHKAELRPAVEAAAQKMLATEGWRGLEQSCILLGYLQHKPAASELMRLLKHPRYEVAIGSAWALGKLKVPETYAELLAHATAQHARYIDPLTPGHECHIMASQMCKLFQLFGEVRYREADPLLRLYIPKAVDLGDARTAACWALGKIHEGQTVADLVDQFEARILDNATMPPEVEPVRTMCAVSLGRLKSQSSLDILRRFTTEGSRVSLASWWSIQMLTGEKPPDPVAMTSNVLGWFLQPLNK